VVAQNGAKLALIGAVATDGAQGVLLGVDYAKRLKEIQDDPKIPPQERTKQIVALLGSALRDGVLIYISVRGTKADLENVGGNLARLRDANAEIDLRKAPVVEGRADGKPHTTKVQLDQPMQPPQTVGASTTRPERKAKKAAGPQRTANLDQLYKDAEAALGPLSDLTNQLARDFRGRAEIPPLKDRGRTAEKVEGEYGGDASRMTDLARTSVVFETMKDLERAAVALEARAKVHKHKDRFAAPVNGYRDRFYNLVMPNGHVVEIQLHIKPIFDVKMGPGHALYEKQRAILDKAKIEKRPLTSAEKAEVARFEDEMKALYDEAFKTVQ
jgi:hypothetical protein